VVQARASQIQGGGQPPSWKNKKSSYLSSGLTDRMTFGMMTHFHPPDATLKIWKFKKKL